MVNAWFPVVAAVAKASRSTTGCIAQAARANEKFTPKKVLNPASRFLNQLGRIQAIATWKRAAADPAANAT